jgi:hypothetical protein
MIQKNYNIEKYMNILYVLGLISNFELKLKIIPITIENLLLIKIINYLEILELEKFKSYQYAIGFLIMNFLMRIE